MKEIAIHSPRVSYYYGGAERYILNVLIELSKKHHNISLISYDAPEKTEWFNLFLKKFNGKVYLLKSKKMDKNFEIFKNATKPKIWDRESRLFGSETFSFYKKIHFDFVVCHYAVDCIYLPIGTKIFLHLHGLPDKKRLIENKAIKIPRKIIAVSKYVSEGWSRLHNISKKIEIVQNGIFIEQEYFSKKSNDIIYFGRLIKIKGVDVLLKSIKELERDGIFMKTIIVGDGPEKNNLISISKKLNLKNVVFTGRIADKDLFRMVRSSKMSVFPSYKREGIMTSLLESSKFGSCIIASDSCSNREFIKNGKNGLLFNARDPKDLSKKIKIVVSNEKLRKELINNSYKTLKKFTWEKQAKKLENIYFSFFSKFY